MPFPQQSFGPTTLSLFIRYCSVADRLELLLWAIREARKALEVAKLRVIETRDNAFDPVHDATSWIAANEVYSAALWAHSAADQAVWMLEFRADKLRREIRFGVGGLLGIEINTDF